MNTNYQLLKQKLLELSDLIQSKNANDSINLITRRKLAQSVQIIFKQLEKEFLEEEKQELKKLIKSILLESWTKQLLPNTSGIIKNQNLKKEDYINISLDTRVVEPREYIGINPEAESDAEFPSLVTALTPAEYTQPLHKHLENWEVTLYTNESQIVYYVNGEKFVKNIPKNTFSIVPANTYHTISNPNHFAVKNLSVKMPGALFDRDEGNPQNSNGEKMAFVRDFEIINTGEVVIKKTEFEDLGLPYNAQLYEFKNENSNYEVVSEGKSLLYILSGEFISILSGVKKVLSIGDVVILDKNKLVTLVSISDDGEIYQITVKN